MDLLAAHEQLLEARRGALNLVGPGPVAPHYRDSEEAIGWLRPAGHWADLGSGAGFPGIVFAARFPQVAVDLVDRRRKRCTFLEAVLLLADDVSSRPSPLRVLCAAVEDLPAQSYDGLVSRAFAPPPVVLDHARRLLRVGGSLVLLLQDDAQEPIAADWQPIGRHRYRFADGWRKSVELRYAP